MGVLKNLYDLREKSEIQKEIEDSVNKFINSGGTITVVPNRRKGRSKLTANGKTSGQVFFNLYN